ncbi:MAG: glutaredoxin family protein [Burkholderiales bacterium]|nr:glutaredoxin family protein [Burkholderiales bacterium]
MMCLPALFRLVPALAGLSLAAVMAASVHAQPVYRIVGPDGKVTFSDKPPPDAKPAAGTANAGSTSNAGSRAALPYELQQLAGKYPVTLYSANGCGPCDAGRALLTHRGVPFTEKTVNTNEDLAAFARISKENALPLLMIGGQAVKGYSDGEWSSYLDAAGYPKQSVLPASYKPAAAEPLSPLKTAAQAPTPTEAGPAATTGSETRPSTQTRPRPPAPPPPHPHNPAGIRF